MSDGRPRLVDDEGVPLNCEAFEEVSRTALAPVTAEKNPANQKLSTAIQRGDPAGVREAVAQGASLEYLPDEMLSPLRVALSSTTERLRRGVCQVLVEAGAPIDGYNWEDPEICVGIEDRDDQANIARTTEILDLGGDVNGRTRTANLGGVVGDTGLHRAILHSRYGFARFLVARGASLEVRNRDGQTPLELLAELMKSEKDRVTMSLLGISEN